jgi:Transposase domain (DUF772)
MSMADSVDRIVLGFEEGSHSTIGTKARLFTPVPQVSLEELVPADHFYRHLDRVLDLSFVCDLVKETYASTGRPSIDPVVFFKLQLVMFFEDIRSERLLMRLVANNTKFIAGMMEREVSKAVYEEFLPHALADGQYVAAPEPIVIG